MTTTANDSDVERVELMLRTAKTKSELQDLVRMLDRRNVQLQNVIRSLTTPEVGE